MDKLACPLCHAKSIHFLDKYSSTPFIQLTCPNCKGELRPNSILFGLMIFLETAFFMIFGSYVLFVHTTLNILILIAGLLFLEYIRAKFVPLVGKRKEGRGVGPS